MNLKNCLVATIFAACIGCFVNVNVYASTNTIRIGGTDRYNTSVEISKSEWKDGTSEFAILTTGENYPDALSAVPLAKKLNAPILLTNKDQLTPDTESELNRLGANTVYIIGGTGVVSSDVENKLKSMNIDVIRLGGADRYETSIKIAEELGTPKQLAVTTGDDFSDALSIAPIAALENMPIILVPKDYVPDSVKNYLSTVNVDKTYIVGGTDIISDTVSESFKNTYRIGGADKYERNIAIIETFPDYIHMHTLYIATGNDFPDALSGAVIASEESSPIVLVGNAPTIETKSFINQNKASIAEYKILGGEGAVSSTTLNSLLAPDSDSTIDKGSIEGTTYTNNQIGFTMNWPQGWVSDYMVPNDAFLLSIYRYPLNSGKIPCSLASMAIDIGTEPSIKTANDFLSGIENKLEDDNYTVNKNISSASLGGQNFDVLDVKKAGDYGININQRFYVTVIKNFLVGFVVTYTDFDTDGLNNLNNVLNTVKFTN